MSLRGWQNRIRDVLDAIAEIQKFTRGMDYETFKNDLPPLVPELEKLV